MRTIQEVGTEILTGKPKSLYIFAGSEYGIKRAYLRQLKQYYQDAKEVATVADVITLMSTRHIVPLKPALYIVRYDDQFISDLSEVLANKLRSLKIVGTLVCIFDNAKHAAKLDKYLSDVTVSVDSISPAFIAKYLQRDYPNVSSIVIQMISNYAADYCQADLMCSCISHLSPTELANVSQEELHRLFNIKVAASEEKFKQAVASRNFSRCLAVMKDMPQLDSSLYLVLSTMVELDKALSNKYASSYLREYASRWTAAEIYNMFQHVFYELVQLRTSNSDPENSLIYIFGLMQFKVVPQWEAT